jgi:hypothetical protein
MSDRRDPAEEDLRDRLDELESTLVDLREQLDDDRRDTPRIPQGLPGGGRRPPRPPRLREVLRFTEEYTIPTLISILEVNVRLLRLAGAALRALDPERAAVPADGDSAVSRAIDAGQGLSTDRLRRGLEDLNDALAGTEATDPEARELLSEAEELSAEIQDRLREASEATGSGREGSSAGQADRDAVSIDVTDGGGDEATEPTEEEDEAPEPDVDAELDSIREEVRGDDEEDGAGDAAEDDEPDENADGTAAE